MSPEDIKNETNIIKQIAFNNGYDPNIVDKQIAKIKTKREAIQAYKSQPQNPSTNKYVSLPYLGPFSYKISRILSGSQNNIKLSFKSTNSLGSILINNKQTIVPIPQKKWSLQTQMLRLSCHSILVKPFDLFQLA
ncbi:unnamed protein product [Ceutorhynchus assimilis]|uniref:Uncharacterized protein n=1 Tax=Ceutorhynchus assimilis TaxID=467358 RepID=A0A9N9QQL5_9CUCU|nr:unnamed protein product [Ceutorhynchus assimilis]